MRIARRVSDAVVRTAGDDQLQGTRLAGRNGEVVRHADDPAIVASLHLEDVLEMDPTDRNFRQVLYTGPKSQLVVMALKPGENIGLETHPDVDQFVRIEEGVGKAVLDGVEHRLEAGWAVVISAGTEHDVVNTSDDEPLKLYTIYTPPAHADGTVHATKAEAEADPHEH